MYNEGNYKQDVFFPDPIDLTFCPLSLQELFKWPTPVALFVDILQATRAAFSPFLKSSKCLRVSVFTSLLAPCDHQSETELYVM